MSSPTDNAGTDAPLIVADGAAMTFPSGDVRALAPLGFGVGRGDFVSIVGPSGCGKSTLLRLVAGLLRPTEGTLMIGGRPPQDARRDDANALSFVFQQAALLPWRTVAGNVALPLELEGAGRLDRRARVKEMLELVGLAEFARAYPHQLSGGMQMRVSLARALATRPSVLLLDEPFGALDEIARQRLNEELLRLWSHDGFTALFVTHNVYEAAFLSRRVIVMSKRPGRIAADIAVPFDHPRTAALRAEPEFARLCGEIGAALEKGSE